MRTVRSGRIPERDMGMEAQMVGKESQAQTILLLVHLHAGMG